MMETPQQLAEKVRKDLDLDPQFSFDATIIAALNALLARLTEAEKECSFERRAVEILRCGVEILRKQRVAVEADRDSYRAVVDAARALYERVQMDESVGICLSERATTLLLGEALEHQAKGES
jgi:hypothetical protein